MDKMSLGDRMKEYERSFKSSLPKRLPVIIRLDGRAFHTYTQKCEKPFDFNFIECMKNTAIYVCDNIQGVELGYVQSDEISLLLHNYKQLNTEPWFNNNIQKMVSISAGLASSYFSLNSEDLVQFDSRVFVLPEDEVCNYFIWRQQDWERNSIQMLGQSLYSHKELQNKNNSEVQDMCFQKGKNWNDLPTYIKRGVCCVKRELNYFETTRSRWEIDDNIPIFTQNREYIEKLLEVGD